MSVCSKEQPMRDLALQVACPVDSIMGGCLKILSGCGKGNWVTMDNYLLNTYLIKSHHPYSTVYWTNTCNAQYMYMYVRDALTYKIQQN